MHNNQNTKQTTMNRTFSVLIFAMVLLSLNCYEEDSNNINRHKIKQLIDKHKIEDINSFILGKFLDHDLILIGEKHYKRIYNQKIIELLNCWIDRIVEDDFPYRKIGLVLESTPVFLTNFNSFIKNGDITQLSYSVNINLNATLAELEYYFDLRDLILHIENLNSKQTKNNPLCLEIICPEKEMPLWVSEEERLKWFNTERDIYSSKRIFEKMNLLRDYKFLGVYGGAHISKKRDKNTERPILAHEIIKKGIKTYTIARSIFLEDPYQTNLDNNMRDFLLPLSVLDSLSAFPNSADCDSWIFYNTEYFYDIIIHYIPSINIVKNILKFINPDSPNKIHIPEKFPEIKSQFQNGSIQRLSQAWRWRTGEEIDGSLDIIDHIVKHIDDIDVVKNLEDMSYFDFLFKDIITSKWPDKYVNRTMSIITGNYDNIEVNIMSEGLTALDYWKRYIRENKEDIQIRLLVAVLYYGTETEQNDAYSLLKRIANIELSTKKEWLNWYKNQVRQN